MCVYKVKYSIVCMGVSIYVLGKTKPDAEAKAARNRKKRQCYEYIPCMAGGIVWLI